MDDFDRLLFEAWHRLGAAVRARRIRALKRSRRRSKAVLKRPMREMCLVIRAADTRITDANAFIDPEDADLHREPHVVTLDGELIRALTKPVSIPWPGVDYEEAARICGRDYMTIAGWVRSGIFQVNRYPEFGFPPDGRRPLRPFLWTPSPIDPNAIECRPPHRIWGTWWRSLWQKLPLDYVVTAQRVPHMVCNRGTECFRGWYWLCPGRVNEHGDHVGCGRRCSYLYAPQSVWTIGQALNDVSGFDMPADCGLVGQWFPALHDASRASGPRSFACRECWKVRSAWMAHSMGWNQVIAQLSGGLLYGRDVPRPPEYEIEKLRYPKKGPKKSQIAPHDNAVPGAAGAC
jgi:hypothetical protein